METDPGQTELLSQRIASLGGLSVERGKPLGRLTTLRIGGPAECWVEVDSEAALLSLLTIVEETGAPFQLLGQGSNVLIPDDGLPGVVARLSGDFRQVVIADTTVEAGAAVPLARLARQTTQADLLGLEALAGFPSTVGGAVWMNAGCYGTEMKDVLEDVETVTLAGAKKRYRTAELGAEYRSTVLQRRGEIVTKARFGLRRGDGQAARQRMNELNRRRWSSLPSGVASAGSIFKNPPGDFAGRLIEACGLKGARRGRAEISERHANVIVNRGGARAADVLELMGQIFREVRTAFAVELSPEIVLTGDLSQRWQKLQGAEPR